MIYIRGALDACVGKSFAASYQLRDAVIFTVDRFHDHVDAQQSGFLGCLFGGFGKPKGKSK